MMRCTNVCVPRGAANDATRSPTATWARSCACARRRPTPAARRRCGRRATSARSSPPRPPPRCSASARRRCATRSGTTLALAKLSGDARRASAAQAKRGAKVALRRPASVKGKLVAWACPATVSAGATPPPCSAKVTLRKSATLRLPATRPARCASWWSARRADAAGNDRGARGEVLPSCPASCSRSWPRSCWRGASTRGTPRGRWTACAAGRCASGSRRPSRG